MGAYEVSYDDEDHGNVRQIVFAETPGKAKYSVMGSDLFLDVEFTEIRCKRAKWADGISSGLKLDIAEIKHGWNWWLEDGGEVIGESAIPLIKKYGGVDRMITAYENGKLSYDRENEKFVEARHD